MSITEQYFNENIKLIHENYLKRVKEVYGDVPDYLTKTKFVFGCSPTNEFASGADPRNNTIYINPETQNLEWDIFHESEHLRTAHKMYGGEHDVYCGTRINVVLHNDEIDSNATNEAMTEISVHKLLQAKKGLAVGYVETEQYLKQLMAVIGNNEQDLLKFYTNDERSFYNLFDKVSLLLGKDITDLYFYILEKHYENHISDIAIEWNKNHYIDNKPLGSKPNPATVNYRDIMKQIFDLMFKRIKETISEEEFENRIKLFNSLAPDSKRLKEYYENLEAEQKLKENEETIGY